ncbi:MAG: response regulator [Candidatus Omnitrophica bacterium]|nr:response regulator [Candidatus Omnitrophota bacterium]MDD5437001.1 response regulator [Candidatus Omnitrophota bacterium]
MKKILIVDDEEGFRFFVKTNLEIRGDYEVASAPDGIEGLRLAGEYRPDLILLDILMPKMDGFKVLEELKGSEKTKSIPVIMLTARSSDDARLKALNLGSDGYVVKPFEMAELEEKIEQALNNGEK